MGAMVVPLGVQVRLIWNVGTTLVGNNVLGAVKLSATTIDQAFANTLGAAIKAGYVSSGLASRQATNWNLSKVGVRDVSTANLAEFVDAAGPQAGTLAAAQTTPFHTAFVVTLRTAKAGKRYRGRVFLPGVAEESVNGAALDALHAADYVDFITAIDAAMTASGLDFAVLSRPVYQKDPLGNEVLIRPGEGTPVTSILKRNDVASTQRRRLSRFRD